jgi:ParB family chromosome partitioning protein
MVENLQREDLNALDKASAFKNYLDSYGGTQEELAGRLGLDRSTVSNLMRLLELPAEVQDAVRNKKITQGHARALLGLDSAEAQVAACARIIAETLSVRQTEALVQTGAPTPSKTRIRKDPAHDTGGKAPHVIELEGSLRERFGTAVQIRVKARDRGQIVIDFNTREEFDRVTALIRGS